MHHRRAFADSVLGKSQSAIRHAINNSATTHHTIYSALSGQLLTMAKIFLPLFIGSEHMTRPKQSICTSTNHKIHADHGLYANWFTTALAIEIIRSQSYQRIPPWNNFFHDIKEFFTFNFFLANERFHNKKINCFTDIQSFHLSPNI